MRIKSPGRLRILLSGSQSKKGALNLLKN